MERINSLLTGQNQEGRPSASTGWGLRGQEIGDNKYHNTRPGIPAEKEKHKLMTTMMSYVSWEVPQLSKSGS